MAAGVVALLAACGGDGDGASRAGAADVLDTLDVPEGVEIERVGDYRHAVVDVEYGEPAPSGGDHLPSPAWLNCGVYDGEVPDELAVHSLEHGAVWIALGPDATGVDRAAAAALADREPDKVIVSDVPDLAGPVELVAWALRLRLDRADDPRAAAFVESYVDGPTAPEAGSACALGFGEPPTPPDLPVE